MLIAVPKKGRLSERALHLLTQADLHYHRRSRSDIALCKVLNIALVFLPAKDIALYVGEGSIDMGITGHDVINESRVTVEKCLDLGFGNCRLCLLAPQSKNLKTADLVGRRIITSFPNLTKQFFGTFKANHATTIKTVSGSVESACALGLADGVVDLVESGETIKAAGLVIVEEIMQTNAVVISNARSKHKDLIERIHTRLEGVVKAENFAMIEYNIARDNFPKAKEVTPGNKAPTVLPLEKSGWVAVKAMIRKSESNEIIEKLQMTGAADILVYHINNCRI